MADPVPTPTRAPSREVELEDRPTPSRDGGEHDRFTHYVSKRELARARRSGAPVTALCGKRWVPDGDPSRYPMCPTCVELAAERLARQLGG